MNTSNLTTNSESDSRSSSPAATSPSPVAKDYSVAEGLWNDFLDAASSRCFVAEADAQLQLYNSDTMRHAVLAAAHRLGLIDDDRSRTSPFSPSDLRAFNDAMGRKLLNISSGKVANPKDVALVFHYLAGQLHLAQQTTFARIHQSSRWFDLGGDMTGKQFEEAQRAFFLWVKSDPSTAARWKESGLEWKDMLTAAS